MADERQIALLEQQNELLRNVVENQLTQKSTDYRIESKLNRLLFVVTVVGVNAAVIVFLLILQFIA